MANSFEGSLDGRGLHIAVVSARFNALVTERLLAATTGTLERYGVATGDIDVFHVPGSFEIPLAAKAAAATGRYDAVVCLGAVVRGDTDHYNYVAGGAASGIANAALDTGVPIIFGVLTTDTMEQALDRAGGKAGNKGVDAAVAAIETASLLKSIRSGS